jgi:hypothetical protein
MPQGLDLATSMFPPPGRPPSTSSSTPNPFLLPQQQQFHSSSIPNAPSSTTNSNFGFNPNPNSTSNSQHDFYIDPSTAWYMPFNLDPPSAPPQVLQDAPASSAAPNFLTSPDLNMGWFDGVSGGGAGMGTEMMPEMNLDGFEWSSAAQQGWRCDDGMGGMYSGGAGAGAGVADGRGQG